MTKGRGNIRFIGVALPDVDPAREVDVNDASLAPMRHPVWAFGAAKRTYLDVQFECDPEFNQTRALHLEIPWSSPADTDLSHTVEWQSFFLKLAPSGVDIESVDMLTEVADTVLSQLGFLGSGRQTPAEILIDNLDHQLGGGDTFVIRLAREPLNDTLLGDAYLHGQFSVTEAMEGM